MNTDKQSSSWPVWPDWAIFEKFWRQIFLQKQSKYLFANFLAFFEKTILFQQKLSLLLFGHFSDKIGLFYSNIWSLWSWPKKKDNSLRGIVMGESVGRLAAASCVSESKWEKDKISEHAYR